MRCVDRFDVLVVIMEYVVIWDDDCICGFLGSVFFRVIVVVVFCF